MLTSLLEELREEILNYCHIDDIKSLSLVNKEHNALLHPYLFHTVTIPGTVGQWNIENEKQTKKMIVGLIDTHVVRMPADHFDVPKHIYTSVSQLHHLRELHSSSWSNVTD